MRNAKFCIVAYTFVSHANAKFRIYAHFKKKLRNFAHAWCNHMIRPFETPQVSEESNVRISGGPYSDGSCILIVAAKKYANYGDLNSQRKI